MLGYGSPIDAEGKVIRFLLTGWIGHVIQGRSYFAFVFSELIKCFPHRS
jgi:hypothetical protein